MLVYVINRCADRPVINDEPPNTLQIYNNLFIAHKFTLFFIFEIDEFCFSEV